MSEVLFKSKAPAQLSPARQALADAIQNLKALEDQHDTLATSIQLGGKSFNAIIAGETAIERAEQDLKSAQQAQVAEMAGGSAKTMTPRQARDAIEHARQAFEDAKRARDAIKQQISTLATQIGMSRLRRDGCVNAVLTEHFAPKVADLVSEIAALQHKLVEKAQLLYELAGSIVPSAVTHALPQPMERVDGNAPAWQIPTTPAPLLVRYRESVARLRTDATTQLGD